MLSKNGLNTWKRDSDQYRVDIAHCIFIIFRLQSRRTIHAVRRVGLAPPSSQPQGRNDVSVDYELPPELLAWHSVASGGNSGESLQQQQPAPGYTWLCGVVVAAEQCAQILRACDIFATVVAWPYPHLAYELAATKSQTNTNMTHFWPSNSPEACKAQTRPQLKHIVDRYRQVTHTRYGRGGEIAPSKYS
jgi:hypothetical protein